MENKNIFNLGLKNCLMWSCDICNLFQKLEELENLDFKMDVPCAILTFKTRRDAEMVGKIFSFKYKALFSTKKH